VPGSGRTGGAGAAGAADVQRRLQSGQLTAGDFQGLSRGQAAEMVATLAKGSVDQRDNLMRLMGDAGFAQHLTTALNEMGSADRGRVLKSVGEAAGRPDAAAVQGTLRTALDGMVGSRRTEMLRDALLEGDSAATRAVNGYLGGDKAKAADFLRSVSGDAAVNDQKLATVFNGLDESSRREALRGLSEGGDAQAREVFKRLGDATFDSQQDRLRGQLEGALDALPKDARNELLRKVITDPAGNTRTDQQVNKGQRLVAEYLERKGPQTVQELQGHFAARGEGAAFQSFVNNNFVSPEVQRAMQPGPSGSVDRGKLKTADDRADTLINTMWQGELFEGRYSSALTKLNSAELHEHFGKLSVGDVSKLMNAFGRFGSPTDGDRIAVVGHVAANGTPETKAKLAAGLAKAYVDGGGYYFDSDKTKAREEIGKLLKSDPNGLVREMASEDLKNVFKASLKPPADLSEIKAVLPQLSPQNAAKMAKALNVAAKEVAAEVQTGGRLGDVLKGLTISGKMGRSAEVGGEMGIEGGKVSGKAGMSREIGFSWSPAALVDGERKRELNQVTSELNSLMMTWTDHLNTMSPNQKAAFLKQMKDEVTLQLN
jgi:hypothetical protein